MRDPRVAILWTIGYVLTLAWPQRPEALRLVAQSLLLAAAMVVWRVPVRPFLLRLTPALSLAAAALAGMIFGAPPQQAVSLGVRLLLISGATVALGLAMPITPLIAGLRSLGLPATAASVLLLTSRYVWLLAEEVTRVRRAWLARASGASWLLRARSLGRVAVARTSRLAERSDRIAWAMIARGFRGQLPCAPLGRLTPVEAVVAALGLLLAAAPLAWMQP